MQTGVGITLKTQVVIYNPPLLFAACVRFKQQHLQERSGNM